MDVAAFIQQMTNQVGPLNQQIIGAGNDLTQSIGTAQQSFDQSNTLGAKAAQETQQAATTGADINFTKGRKSEQVQDMYNMDPMNPDNFIGQQLSAKVAAQGAYKAARMDYDEVAQQSLLDNPIQFLIGRLQLPSLAAKVNSASDAIDNADNNINQANIQLKSTQDATIAHTADLVRNQELEIAQAEKDRTDAALVQAAGNNTARLGMMRLEASKVFNLAFDNQVKVAQIQLSQENLEEARALRKQQSDQNNYMKQLQQMMLEDKLDEREATRRLKDRMNGQLAAMAQSAGMAIPPTYDEVMKMPTAQKQLWINGMNSGGFGSDAAAAADFYLGITSPGVVRNKGGAGLFDTARRIQEYRDQELRNVEFDDASKGVKASRKEQLERTNNKIEDQIQLSLSGNAKYPDLGDAYWDSKYNPYKAPLASFQTAIQTNPTLQESLGNNLVTKAVNKMLADGSIAKTKDGTLDHNANQQVLTYLGQLVATRQATSAKLAADVSSYYTGATTYQRSISGYTLLGLPKQDTYPVTFNAIGKRIDLMNPVAVENAMTRYAMDSSVKSTGKFMAHPFAAGANPFEGLQ